ncbi:MAG: hypothetical protein WKF73_08040 [Nocardioidaceae bacterium]
MTSTQVSTIAAGVGIADQTGCWSTPCRERCRRGDASGQSPTTGTPGSLRLASNIEDAERNVTGMHQVDCAPAELGRGLDDRAQSSRVWLT